MNHSELLWFHVKQCTYILYIKLVRNRLLWHTEENQYSLKHQLTPGPIACCC